MLDGLAQLVDRDVVVHWMCGHHLKCFGKK
jgi:hypothetical protein